MHWALSSTKFSHSTPPFHRKSLDLLRKTLHLERIINPLESAPYRDIPQLLADVVMRCLRQDSKERFQRVDEIISEINSYIEGRPEWIPTTQLSIEKKRGLGISGKRAFSKAYGNHALSRCSRMGKSYDLPSLFHGKYASRNSC